jgi:hypothetical protein
MFLRLRQLCLVARDLKPVVDDLTAVFDIAVCHRDPEVGRFGLHNAILPIGTFFIEVVAPIQEGTTAGRYLERRRGDGGYMVILDSDGLDAWQDHVERIGVRVATLLTHERYRGMQLHPRDTGGALMEINWSRGGGPIDGPYNPAGPNWQQYVRTDVARSISGVELQSEQPERLGRRWSEILQRPIERMDEGSYQLAVDNAELNFVPALDGRGEGLGGIHVNVGDRQVVRARAEERGLALDGDCVLIGGVRFRFSNTES